jgi:hypothetical protein
MNLEKIKYIGKTPKKKIRHKYGDPLRVFAPYATKIFLIFNLGPTVASLLSIFICLFGSLLFLSGNIYWIIMGILIHHLGYFFDIIDGQIARIQKKSNVSGGYIDAINHFFNIPIFFVCLSLGFFAVTKNFLFVYLAILSALFSRGNAKYNLAKSVIDTIDREKIGEQDKIYFSLQKKVFKNNDNNSDEKIRVNDSNGGLDVKADLISNHKKDSGLTVIGRWVIGRLQSCLIFPNFLGVFLVISIIDVILSNLFSIQSTIVLQNALIAYILLYIILELIQITMHYINKTADKIYLRIKNG